MTKPWWYHLNTEDTQKWVGHAVLTGIERQQVEESQAKLQQRRHERYHFSDGVPVALYEGLATIVDMERELWDV